MDEVRTLPQLLTALRRGYMVSNGRVVPPPLPQAARTPEKAERHFCVSLAGHAVAIDALHGNVYRLCKEYLCGFEPEIRVRMTEDDLAYERAEAIRAGTLCSDGYLETLAVYRKISEAMLDYDTFLMHGAVVATGGEAFMFTAPSGTGKTTHIRKWLDNLPGAFVVNGDKPLIRITNDNAIACGTPWCGKESMGTNAMVPLKAIVLMERAEDNAMAPVGFDQAFTSVLQQTYRPRTADQMRSTLTLLSRLGERISLFRFGFNNLKADAFDVAYSALVGKRA